MIDTAVLYLVMGFGFVPGNSLRIRGLFPNARYMSYTLYSGSTLSTIDHLTDRSIVPDPWNTNPFQPLANRKASRRSYTLYIQQGSAPAGGRAQNTLYTGSNRPVLGMYRVYAPDRGADGYGNVPKPYVDILSGSPADYSSAFPLQPCASPQPIPWKASVVLKVARQWQRIGARNADGANADDAYLVARLNRSDAPAYVMRFRPPSFAQTYKDQPITGREDVRYWSVCQYDMASEKAIACLHDDQAVRDSAGNVTIVVSTRAVRVRGINWLPFGPEPRALLWYRQLLPNPSFRGSFKQVKPGASQAAM